MSDVLEILKRGDNSLEALLRAVLLDSENKVPSDRLRIVGALADGAIIENGHNANGTYIRWADGSQLVFASAIVSCTFNDTIINPWHQATTTDITYAASFTQTPIVLCSTTLSRALAYVCRIVAGVSSFYVNVVAPATVSTTGTCYYFAIGKWK